MDGLLWRLHSTCDSFGTNPNGGELFAMSFDGSDLRQLTETRGMSVDPEGTVTVELPVPMAYAPLSRWSHPESVYPAPILSAGEDGTFVVELPATFAWPAQRLGDRGR